MIFTISFTISFVTLVTLTVTTLTFRNTFFFSVPEKIFILGTSLVNTQSINSIGATVVSLGTLEYSWNIFDHIR